MRMGIKLDNDRHAPKAAEIDVNALRNDAASAKPLASSPQLVFASFQHRQKLAIFSLALRSMPTLS